MKRKTKRLLIEFCAAMIILVVLLIFIIPKFLDAQNINTPKCISDPVFRAYIEDAFKIEPGGHITANQASELEKLPLDDMSRRGLFINKLFSSGISGLAANKARQKKIGELINQMRKIDGQISDLTGLKYFKNLKELYCNKQNIGALDMSKNKFLKILECRRCSLKTLDISNNPNLEVLNCQQNNLDALDVSQNKALKILICHDNNIKFLDVSHNPNLVRLNFSQNNIKSIDVTNNPLLTNLNSRKNSLSTIDLSNNLNLDFIDLAYNQLSDMPDLRKHTKLEGLSVEFNNLGEDDRPRITVLLDRFTGTWSISGDHVSKGILYEEQNNYDFRLSHKNN